MERIIGHRTREYRPHVKDIKVYRQKSYFKPPGQEERILAHMDRIQKALKEGVE